MSEQLILELAPREPPSFANFLPGRNGEALDALVRLAGGVLVEPGLLLWGAPAGGKTHLLHATVAAALARGSRAAFVTHPGMLAALDPQSYWGHALVAVDRVDEADEEAQGRLFTLYNVVRAGGGHLLAAAGQAPATMPIREDLRSRLAWGLVYEIHPLSDDEKRIALAAFAHQRGFRLSGEVTRYLLVHVRRDMGALLATLQALDRYSLATRRAVTVPMLREWLRAGNGPGSSSKPAP